MFIHSNNAHNRLFLYIIPLWQHIYIIEIWSVHIAWFHENKLFFFNTFLLFITYLYVQYNIYDSLCLHISDFSVMSDLYNQNMYGNIIKLILHYFWYKNWYIVFICTRFSTWFINIYFDLDCPWIKILDWRWAIDISELWCYGDRQIS